MKRAREHEIFVFNDVCLPCVFKYKHFSLKVVVFTKKMFIKIRKISNQIIKKNCNNHNSKSSSFFKESKVNNYIQQIMIIILLFCINNYTGNKIFKLKHSPWSLIQ